MTTEVAITDIRENIKPVVGGISLDMAIEALERQIPKEPIQHGSLYGMYGWFECPNCHENVTNYWGWYVENNYCRKCGQCLKEIKK